MVRTQVQLSEEQLQALRKLSATRGRPITGVIREAVDQYLSSQKSVSCQRIERALRVAGKFSSGCTDISSHHVRYFAEALRPGPSRKPR